MRDEIDQLIELMTIIIGIGYIASATAYKYPNLIYLYQDLAIFTTILLILDITYHIFRRRLYMVKEKISSPIIIGVFILLFIGFISLNPNIYINIKLQLTTIQETTLQIELLPHITILLIMTTTLFLSNTLENHYHNKLSKTIKKVMGHE